MQQKTRKDINLLPKRYIERKKTKALLIKLSIAQIVIIAILLITQQLLRQTIYTQTRYLQEISYLEPHIIEANKIADNLALLQQELLEINELMALTGITIGNEQYIDIVLQKIPQSLSPRYISYSNSRILLNVMVYDINQLPIFIDTLNDTRYFDRVQVMNAINVDYGILFSVEILLGDRDF